jgi:hypothetical protein
MTADDLRDATSWRGDLALGDVLQAAGIADLSEVLVIRHTSKDSGLRDLHAVTPEAVLDYTRRQRIAPGKFPSHPPRYWLVFLADGKYRSRFYAAYENSGEVVTERTDADRYYDLQPTDLLASLADRLVIDWGADAINWAKSGTTAAAFKVVEIADRDAVAFPGFDQVALTHAELQLVANDPRYGAWRAALGSVQGIYVISDASNGKLYVGQADGHERILGRWRDYAATGHGGNKRLVDALAADPGQVNHWTWSILRAFGSSEPPDAVDKAEQHFIRVLRTREFGYN